MGATCDLEIGGVHVLALQVGDGKEVSADSRRLDAGLRETESLSCSSKDVLVVIKREGMFAG